MKFAGLIAGAFLLAGTCQAITALGDPLAVLGNLPGTMPYTGDAATLSGSIWVAVGVTTGNTELQFTSMEGYFSNSGGGSPTVTGWIYSDSAGAPGSIVGTFNSDVLSSQTIAGVDNLNVSSTLETFTTTQTVDLQANTNYWFVIEDAPEGVSWRSDSANSGAGTVAGAENSSGYSFVGYDGTSNSGGNWTALTSEGNPTFEIDASPLSAPEPASIFLILSGCACLLVSHRLRRAR